ncbi:MAG: hypothetical protein P1P84_19025 [Deferrisomatales bacterium]|nr:hypothetical protein [Deferrisomatales bacterium]
MRGAYPRRRGIALLGLALLAGGWIGGCDSGREDPEESLLRERCGLCHRYDNALNKRKSATGWERTVWAMRQRGAELSDQEAEQLVRYLTQKRALP